jgi:outer membrane protein TolC
VALFIIVTHAAMAQPDMRPLPANAAPPLTLSAALRSALESGSAARNQALDSLQQQAQWEAAQSEFSPKLSLSSNARRQWSRGLPGASDEANVIAGMGWKLPRGTRIDASLSRELSQASGTTTRPVTRVLELTQPLLKGAGSAAGFDLEQARLAEQIGQYQRNQALDDVFVVVSLAYFDAVLARQQVDLALQALERVAQAKAVNQALHQAGRLAQVELLQSDADLAQAELELEQARNGVLTADSALLQWLGPEWAQRPPGDLILADTVTGTLPDAQAAPPAPALTASLADQHAQALAQRSDLQLALTAVQAAQVSVAQAANEGRATLDLALRVQSATASALNVSGGREHSISVAWSVPLDRSLLRLQHTQAQVGLRRAELALEDAQRQVRREVADASRELGFAQRQMGLSATTVALNRRKLDAETERLRAGKTSSFQLSAAQDALRAAEATQAQAALAVQRAQIQQARALGTLAAQRQALMQAAAPP